MERGNALVTIRPISLSTSTTIVSLSNESISSSSSSNNNHSNGNTSTKSDFVAQRRRTWRKRISSLRYKLNANNNNNNNNNQTVTTSTIIIRSRKLPRRRRKYKRGIVDTDDTIINDNSNATTTTTTTTTPAALIDIDASNNDVAKPPDDASHQTSYFEMEGQVAVRELYKYIYKKSYLDWGSRDTDDSSKTASQGYGETTEGAMRKLLEKLATLDDERLRLNETSSFVDIGSGYGKVVFHAKVQCRVARSVGYEYVASRVQIANEVLAHFRRNNRVDLRGVCFVCGDVTKCFGSSSSSSSTTTTTTTTAMLDFSHVYMYDKVFYDATYRELLPIISRSPCVRVFVCYRRPEFLKARGMGDNFELVDSLVMRSTGKQQFKCYIYKNTAATTTTTTTTTTPTTTTTTTVTRSS